MVKKLQRWLPFFVYFLPFKLFGMLPRKRRVILFATGTGLFHDNPRYLMEMFQRHFPNRFDYIWSTRDKDVYQKLRRDGVPVILQSSIAGAWTASKAHAYIVSAEMLDAYYHIHDNTLLIQSWHGTPVKHIEHDSPTDDVRLARKKRYFGKNHLASRVNHFLIDKKDYIPMLSAAFQLAPSRFRAIGQARNVVMSAYGNQDIQDLRRKRGLDSFERVLLYAPTFRESLAENMQLVERLISPETTAYLKARNWCLLIKLHPFLTNGQLGNGEWVSRLVSSHIKDLSSDNDTPSLLALSDALISDFSSLMLDFMRTGRPMYQFVPDGDVYWKKRGGAYQTKEEIDQYSESVDAISDIKNISPHTAHTSDIMNEASYIQRCMALL